MVNPALLSVSVVFYLGTSAALYVVGWLCLTLLSRLFARFSSSVMKSILFAALILPPLVALLSTAEGDLFRHSHLPNQQHHSEMCGDVFQFLMTTPGQLPSAAGIAVLGATWALLVWGGVKVVKLLRGTSRLAHEIAPHLEAPSPKLEVALGRLSGQNKISRTRFFEAAIPMTYSCLLGFRHVRCILSKELVASATEQELVAIVIHEVNHIRLGDVWLTWLVESVNHLFFFLRPAQLLAQRWREATKLTCDAMTVAVTQQPLALASAILHAQGVSASEGPLPTTTLCFADEAACATEKRVDRLLSLAQNVSIPAAPLTGGWWRWTVTLALAAFGVLTLLSPQAMCAAHCSLEAIAHTIK